MAKKQNPELLKQLENIKSKIKNLGGNIAMCFFEQRSDLFNFDGIVKLESEWIYLLLNYEAEISNDEILRISKAIEALNRLYNTIKNKSSFK